MDITKPLTQEEVKAASEQFFPLFETILDHMPEGSSIEDSLKVMESVCGLAHKNRVRNKEQSAPFGFNKKDNASEQGL